MKTGQVYALGDAALSSLDPELAADILNAFEFFTSPVEAGHWWFSEACYRKLRTEHWEDIQSLLEDLRDYVDSGSQRGLMLDSRELDLAGAVTECADALEAAEAAETTTIFERIGTIVGIGGGLFGILAFLRG